MPVRRLRLPWGWRSVVLLFWFFAGALLFCTSMLSTSTLMPQTATEVCDGFQPVDQVVVLLIDAMRPDFTLPRLRGFAHHGGDCSGGDAVVSQYTREVGATLTYMEESLRDVNRLSQGYFFVADAPTTTAQRIKAIATGTMPAFLEAGSNFNSEATELDSFVRQAQGRAIILGDDTWTKLFPNDAVVTERASAGDRAEGGEEATPRTHWKATLAIPSFDVADFHTNDDAVLSSLGTVLAQETAEEAQRSAGKSPHAKVVVGHFLGVDHIGHRLNADNPTMHGKLSQLNEMLINVATQLRTRPTEMRTMLLVLGDHGMTNSGDHGGESVQETDTFLYAEYFPGQSQRESSTSGTSSSDARRRREHANALCASRWARKDDPELHRLKSCQEASGVAETKLGAAYQVDVTSTIAVLMGRPIPFSNFGRVLPEVLALADARVDLQRVEQCNYDQFQRYAAAAGMSMPGHPSEEDVRGEDDSAAHHLHARRTQLARFSYYTRKTRSVMNREGMFFGSWMLLVAAFSLLWDRDVQQCLTPGNGAGNWLMLVVVGRLVTVFSNSFVTNEDTVLFALLSTLLWVSATTSKWWWTGPPALSTGTANTAHRGKVRWGVLLAAACFLVLRHVAPYAYRHRFPITHAVESTSVMEQWAALWPIPERIGLILGGALSIALYCRRCLASCVMLLATLAVLAVSYKVPRWHHLAPLTLVVLVTAAARFLSGRLALSPSLYRYLVWVLWCSLLCNENVVAATVIALYGCALPFGIRTLRRVAPDTSVAVQLHLLSYVVFFLQGHQCMLSTIDWNASFVGMTSYSLIGGGILVMSRTFNAFLFAPVACALQDRWPGTRKPHVRDGRKREGEASTRMDDAATSSTAQLRHFVLHVIVVQAAVSCVNGYIQKSHLMLYPIFCPKYLFDVVMALMTGVGVLLSMCTV